MTEKNEQLTEESQRRTLRLSIIEGVSHAFMLGMGENYLSAFAVALKGTSSQIGFLASGTQLVGAVSQLIGVRLLDTMRNRAQFLRRCGLMHACLWPLMALIPLMWGEGPDAVWMLIALACLGFLVAGIMTPTWNSLIGDIVPPTTRGAYFGRRSGYAGIALFTALLIAGAMLELFSGLELELYGFFAIFFVAALGRWISAACLGLHADPAFHISHSDRFTFFRFVSRIPWSNFGKFVLFVGALNAAIWIAAPYYAVYLLRDLGKSYHEYMLITAAAVFSQYLTLRLWGRLSDRIGNKRIIDLCAVAFSVLPLLWIIRTETIYLICIQLVGGAVVAGFNLGVANFLFDAVSPPKRGRCVAYQAVLSAMGMLLGSLLGGYVADRGPAYFAKELLPHGSVFAIVFAVSSMLRICVAYFGVRSYREVRSGADSDRPLFRISHIRPFSGVVFRLIASDRRTRDRGKLVDGGSTPTDKGNKSNREESST